MNEYLQLKCYIYGYNKCNNITSPEGTEIIPIQVRNNEYYGAIRIIIPYDLTILKYLVVNNICKITGNIIIGTVHSLKINDTSDIEDVITKSKIFLKNESIKPLNYKSFLIFNLKFLNKQEISLAILNSI